MKTKSVHHSVSTSFPTYGEVFEFLINALDLPSWGDLIISSSVQNKDRAKTVSDQLRDWASEPDYRVPSRADFVGFIRRYTANIPHKDPLQRILEWLVNRVIGEHSTTVQENTTYLDRAGTRTWYGRGKAPDAIYVLYQLRKLLLRLPDIRGPILEKPLNELLAILWRADAPKHPMTAVCFADYRQTELAATEADVTAWVAGATRPQFRSLARFFRGHDRIPEIMLNFGVGFLIEELAKAFDTCVPSESRSTATKLLTQQATCLALLEEWLEADLVDSSRYSLDDYIRYLDDRVAEFRAEVVGIVNQGDKMLLDLRWAHFHCHREYFESFSRAVPPPDFKSFYENLSIAWNATRLSEPPDEVAKAAVTLTALRNDFTTWCEPMDGVLLAIDARLALVREVKPTSDAMLAALELYRDAVCRSRYRAGRYTCQILKEAIGLAALLQRGKITEGARLLDWIKNALAWWELADLGDDFRHEQEAQRVEKASRQFIDSLCPELRQRWSAALPLPALDHAYYLGGMFGMIAPAAMERLKEPLDKRQKRPIPSAATGRDQSPLMEAIDRRDLVRARELVRDGADLNFINSTGDSCATKAFACEDYDLVLAILRRDENPILRRVLDRVTDKHRHTVLELALCHGRVDILRELAKWKRGRGEEHNLSEQRIQGGVTPLYYAVMLLATHRMSPEEYLRYALALTPESQAGQFACGLLHQSPEIAERFKEFKKHVNEHDYPKGLGIGNPSHAIEVIRYLIDEIQVDNNVTCTKGHTAFTLAVENRMHDIALRLLQADTNVNHRCDDGATALCFAIRNNDYEMVKLLLEYRADDRIFVPVMGRPIHAMPMSERIRELMPRRL